MPKRNPALYTSGSVEWYTPDWIINEVTKFFGGEIGLDPAADPAHRIPAKQHFDGVNLDGLAEPWSHEQVFLNPPYGRSAGMHKWIKKAMAERVAEIILLVPSRTGNDWFKYTRGWPHCFLDGRVKFLSPEGATNAATFDSVLIYRGPRTNQFVWHFYPFATQLMIAMQPIASIMPHLLEPGTGFEQMQCFPRPRPAA